MSSDWTIGSRLKGEIIRLNGYSFVGEEYGAEDDPYSNGMLVYKMEK